MRNEAGRITNYTAFSLCCLTEALNCEIFMEEAKISLEARKRPTTNYKTLQQVKKSD